MDCRYGIQKDDHTHLTNHTSELIHNIIQEILLFTNQCSLGPTAEGNTSLEQCLDKIDYKRQYALEAIHYECLEHVSQLQNQSMRDNVASNIYANQETTSSVCDSDMIALNWFPDTLNITHLKSEHIPQTTSVGITTAKVEIANISSMGSWESSGKIFPSFTMTFSKASH